MPQDSPHAAKNLDVVKIESCLGLDKARITQKSHGYSRTSKAACDTTAVLALLKMEMFFMLIVSYQV